MVLSTSNLVNRGAGVPRTSFFKGEVLDFLDHKSTQALRPAKQFIESMPVLNISAS
jgi:hypothetical protein